MEPEQFSGNSSINDTIFECLQYLDELVAMSIVRKLRTNARGEDKREFFHTFRELILGSYLARNGFRVRAYQEYDGHDPDWSVLGGQGELNALIEVTNFHADDKTESEIDAALAEGKWACPDVKEDAVSLRFHKAIWRKCGKYKDLAKSLDVPYVVGCFCYFNNPVERSTVMENLHSADSGLFRGGDDEGYPDVSGLVVFDEKTLWGPPDTVANAYIFEYFQNPHAIRQFAFPSGNYYPPMSISKREQYQLLVRFLSGAIDKSEYFRVLEALLSSDQSSLHSLGSVKESPFPSGDAILSFRSEET
jgi:hypothetical protein